MAGEQVLMTIIRLGAGAVLAFTAILLWAQTRDTAWMFIIMGIILRYAEIMFTTFELFGVITVKPVVYLGIPMIDALTEILPYVFFFIALVIMLRRTGKRRL